MLALGIYLRFKTLALLLDDLPFDLFFFCLLQTLILLYIRLDVAEMLFHVHLLVSMKVVPLEVLFLFSLLFKLLLLLLFLEQRLLL